ncbi:hypothetical protein WMY93_026957 [Mugilogobius chulae]|uniref:C-type lectin domain-containing protein n=1 Tax=Mugilogobius chulae TaxID=88201 RepID=A0AAW0N3V2_9GOBI
MWKSCRRNSQQVTAFKLSTAALSEGGVFISRLSSSSVASTTRYSKGSKQYNHISTMMTWDEAQSYCRQHHTDLATIEDQTENSAAASVLVANQATWFGLYRKPWRWSDGSDSRFTNWISGQPNNNNEQHCVSELDTREWGDGTCSVTLPFVCAKAFKTRTNTFMLKLQSDVDLSIPSTSMQIIEKVSLKLQDKRLTDFNVKWKVPPEKLRTSQTFNPSCN